MNFMRKFSGLSATLSPDRSPDTLLEVSSVDTETFMDGGEWVQQLSGSVLSPLSLVSPGVPDYIMSADVGTQTARVDWEREARDLKEEVSKAKRSAAAVEGYLRTKESVIEAQRTLIVELQAELLHVKKFPALSPSYSTVYASDDEDDDEEVFRD